MRPEQLATVLRVRKHHRDQVRSAMAKILAEGRALEDRHQQTDLQRTNALQNLRNGMSTGPINVDQIAGLRYHAAQLSIELSQIANAIAAQTLHVKAAQAVLVKAEQGVKAVEKLQERHAAELRLIAERKQDREATDLFTSKRFRND